MPHSSRDSSPDSITDKLDRFGDSLSARLMAASQLRITPFSNAQNQDLEEWLEMYEYAAAGAGWDAVKMGDRLGAHLLGPARAWYQTNVKESAVALTYDEIVKMMRHDFGTLSIFKKTRVKKKAELI